MTFSDTVVSIIRTVIPAAWGSLVAWLLSLIPSLGLVEDQITSLSQIASLVVIGLWYSVTRALEHRMPHWLRNILFGIATTPGYEGFQNDHPETN